MNELSHWPLKFLGSFCFLAKKGKKFIICGFEDGNRQKRKS